MRDVVDVDVDVDDLAAISHGLTVFNHENTTWNDHWHNDETIYNYIYIYTIYNICVIMCIYMYDNIYIYIYDMGLIINTTWHDI